MEVVFGLLWLAALGGSALKAVLSQEIPQDPLYLEGGPLFDITWLDTDEMKLTEPIPPLKSDPSGDDSVLDDLLPNQLLGDDEGKEESLVIRSADQEQYTCVLPDISGNGIDNVRGLMM